MKNQFQRGLVFLSIVVMILACTKEEGNVTSPTTIPVLTTAQIYSITTSSAVSGGTITSNGGSTITDRGVCWSTSPNPTIALSTKTTDGMGDGNFLSTISGLTPNTTYYIRAYATNKKGTAYGNEVNFFIIVDNIDNEGNTFSTVVIGTQEWMRENLNTEHYRNGDVIPQVTDLDTWVGLTTGAWCYYGNNSTNGTTYGKLYNWYAVNDPRGLAPVGWHIPSDAEWTTLTTFLGGEDMAGGKMKATTWWNSPNTGASNSCGFTGISGGCRSYNGTFYYLGDQGNWWSTMENDTTLVRLYILLYNDSTLLSYDGHKASGLSVRCLKD